MNQYAKFAIAALTAGLIAAQTALMDGSISVQDWVTIALAALGALGVYAAPNTAKPSPLQPGRHELREEDSPHA